MNFEIFIALILIQTIIFKFLVSNLTKLSISLCTSVKIGGWVSFSVETVKHRPILTVAPANTTVLIGGNATMNCQVLSDAHRHLEWYHGYHTDLENIIKTNQSLRVEVKVGLQFYLHLHETRVFLQLSTIFILPICNNLTIFCTIYIL